MPVSQRRLLLEELGRGTLERAAQRYVPMWLRFRLWERDDAANPPGKPGAILPGLYGGTWDRRTRSYVGGEPEREEDVSELLCHPGQLEALQFATPQVMRLMLLGGPGSGKTRCLSLLQARWCAEKPSTTGGVVAATRDRVEVIWRDILATIPRHWIDDIREHAGEIILVNGRKLEFVAAKEPSKLVGSPIQGRSWRDCQVDETQNLHDRAQMDIDERGRRVGADYLVAETATRVAHLGHFEDRLDRYKQSKYHAIIRLNPLENTFVTAAYWERFRSSYSEQDWRRRIMSEDVAPEWLTYSAWSRRENVRPAPRTAEHDVTRELTREKFGHLQKGTATGWDWVVGTDWGTLCTASVWLKAFRNPKTGEVDWFAMRETISGFGSTAADHVRELARVRSLHEFIMLADPSINTKDADKSDYNLAAREGATVRPAYHKSIEVKHRVSMLNALLCDAHGKRRLFLDCDEHGHPRCNLLARSFLQVVVAPDGKLEGNKKDYQDPSHLPAALSFGVFPWERIRGLTTFEAVTGADEDPMQLQFRKYADRRSRG